MQKLSILLIVAGGLIGIGIILSFYGNQVIFEGLVRAEGDVSIGKELTLNVELDQAINERGIYAVQTLNFKKDVMSVGIYDPIGIEIKSEKIIEDVQEGEFNIESSGIYQLVIKSEDQEKTKVFGVIGPEPDAGKKSLGFVSLYVLVVGLVGMVGVGIYAVKNRRSR